MGEAPRPRLVNSHLWFLCVEPDTGSEH